MSTEPDPRNDLREQLFNDRLQGPFAQVQVPAERITRLHGILLDIDPEHLRPGNGWFEPDAVPEKFHKNIRPVLNRHPLLQHAEVRNSGRGLHIIQWLDPAIVLDTAARQQRWAAVVKAVQSSLPIDPGMPGITAVTRPVGSVNSRTETAVEILHAGKAVTEQEVESFVAELGQAPFRVLASILLGTLPISPCPVCRKKASRFNALDRIGQCYGGCRRVNLDQLFDLVFAAPQQASPSNQATTEQTRADGAAAGVEQVVVNHP
jgi:hypothetical protein